MKYLVATLGLIVLPVLIESCCGVGNGACPCNPDWVTEFDINGLSMETSLDPNGGVDAPVSAAGHKFYFIARFDVKYYKAEAEPFHLFEYTAGNSAFACSPAEPTSRQKIVSISVTSAHDFTFEDEVYDAGTNLTELFLVTSYEREALAEFVNAESIHETYISAHLKKNVDVAQKHDFKFSFELDNGLLVVLQTGEHELLPE